jgi:hypothetical protein
MLNFKSDSMMRSMLMIITLLTMFLITGANYKSAGAQKSKKHCRGYSVIEVDKGVDCNGDTIRLVKIHGYFERAH